MNILSGMIILNTISLFIVFPGLLLQLNYILKSKGIIVEIGNDTIQINKSKSKTIIEIENIQEIIQISAWSWSKLPWWKHYYYKITDSNGNQVNLNLYCLKDGEIWTNSSGLRKIQDRRLKSVEVFLPLIRKTHNNKG